MPTVFQETRLVILICCGSWKVCPTAHCQSRPESLGIDRLQYARQCHSFFRDNGWFKNHEKSIFIWLSTSLSLKLTQVSCRMWIGLWNGTSSPTLLTMAFKSIVNVWMLLLLFRCFCRLCRCAHLIVILLVFYLWWWTRPNYEDGWTMHPFWHPFWVMWAWWWPQLLRQWQWHWNCVLRDYDNARV
jgi:hypothetical protein